MTWVKVRDLSTLQVSLGLASFNYSLKSSISWKMLWAGIPIGKYAPHFPSLLSSENKEGMRSKWWACASRLHKYNTSKHSHERSSSSTVDFLLRSCFQFFLNWRDSFHCLLDKVSRPNTLRCDIFLSSKIPTLINRFPECTGKVNQQCNLVEVNKVMRFCPQSSSIVRTCPAKGQHTQSYTPPGKEHAFVRFVKVSACSHLEQPNTIWCGILGILWHETELST